MKKPVARVEDLVDSKTGSGSGCSSELKGIVITQGNSSKVFANGKLIVVQGNIVPPHPLPGCSTIDISPLSTFSSSVKIGGKGVAREGDVYGPDNKIVSGSPNVYVGG